MPALALNRQIRVLLADPEIALQDSLRALDQLPRLETLRQLRVLTLQTRQLDFGADQEPNRRDQLNLRPAVLVREAMLEIDHRDQAAAAEHGDRQKGLVVILGQLVEHLEARILEGMATHHHRLPVLRDPAGDALAHPQLEAIDEVPARLLRGAEDQLIVFEHVDETGIALHDAGHDVHHAVEHRFQRLRRGEPAADLVEVADLRMASRADRVLLVTHVRPAPYTDRARRRKIAWPTGLSHHPYGTDISVVRWIAARSHAGNRFARASRIRVSGVTGGAPWTRDSADLVATIFFP